MEVLLTLLLILVIIVLIGLFTMKNELSSKINLLHHRLEEIKEVMARMSKQPETILGDKPKIVTPPVISPPSTIKQQELVPPVEKPIIKEAVKPVPERLVVIENVVSESLDKLPVPKTPRKPGFFERNPDLEKFIGENLANKIGIGILVIGIGFFVKFAIDQNWINEIGRVLIGILCGGALIAVAHYLRKKFEAFSSVLVGGGIAVLYLTIAIAFHEYSILSQTEAFLIMVVITGLTVVLSIGYNRMELAILAILGGFGSPFMVSTGEGNYVILFTYIFILDLGMLALAYFKKWNPVTIIAYLFTLLLFGSWLSSRFNEQDNSMVIRALIFATLFYFVFFAMTIINGLKEKKPFKAVEFSLLLSNSFFYFGAGMAILQGETVLIYRGLFTALLGIFNFIFAFILYRNTRAEKNLVFLLIGLVLTFISLAAPIQLEGNYITLFWSAEAVLLLWLSQKSGIRLMRIASILINVLMAISLVMDWYNIYFLTQNSELNVIFNKGFITGFVSLLSISSTFFILRNEKNMSPASVRAYKTILTITGVVMLYFLNFFELNYHLTKSDLTPDGKTIILGFYNTLFLLGLLISSTYMAISEKAKTFFPAAGFIGAFSHLIIYQPALINDRSSFLTGSDGTGYYFHYLLVAALVALSGITISRMQKLTGFNKDTYYFYSWFFMFFFIFLASVELDCLVLQIAYNEEKYSMDYLLLQNQKIGYPILWGITSFLLIVIGLKWKLKHLRIISLTLFLITLLKLFLMDIQGISEGGKIAAFISLGILLLVVSFMYQRLKKILLDDPGTDSISNPPAV